MSVTPAANTVETSVGRLPLVIELERRFDLPPEALFRLWTDSAQLSRWFGVPLAIDARLGGAVSIGFGNGHDKVGKVVALEAPRYLAFTWCGASGAGQPVEDSTVHVRFTPDGEGTRLSLRHEGLRDPESLAGHSEGWLVYFELWRMLEHAFASAPSASTRERAAISEVFAAPIDPLALVAQWTGASRASLAPRAEADGAMLVETASADGHPIAARWHACRFGTSLALAEGALPTDEARRAAKAAWKQRFAAASAAAKAAAPSVEGAKGATAATT
jgi:uncharacterized protein YndB with AHSA1/START domain